MGQLEKENIKRIRKTKIQHAILATIGTAGLLAVGLLAPNALGAMGRLGIIPRPRHKDVIRSSASHLRKKGLLEFSDGRYSLTKAGESILSRWEGNNFEIKKPRKWDKKWRVIIFDIPEKRKRQREEARRILTEAGFRRLQDSVWIHPFDCEDIISLVKTDLGISRDMLYMIVDHLENDRHLRRDFGLA